MEKIHSNKDVLDLPLASPWNVINLLDSGQAPSIHLYEWVYEPRSDVSAEAFRTKDLTQPKASK